MKLSLSNPLYGQEGGGVTWTPYTSVHLPTFMAALQFLIDNKGVTSLRAEHEKFTDYVDVPAFGDSNQLIIKCKYHDGESEIITLERLREALMLTRPAMQFTINAPGEKALENYALDQWWVQKLEDAYGQSIFDADTRRACKVALDYLKRVLPPTVD